MARGMQRLSPCSEKARGGGAARPGESPEGDRWEGGEAPSRGDSGGGVSQPISDTGDPFLTYGVASRMYFTEREKEAPNNTYYFRKIF